MKNCTFGGFLDSPHTLSYEEKGMANYFHDMEEGEETSSFMSNLSVQHHLLKRV